MKVKALLFYSLIVTLILYSSNCAAQANGKDRFWYFSNAGLDFSTGSPTILTNSALTGFVEGCGTATDANGNLMFYGYGKKIFNRNHVLMAGGGALIGHESAAEGVEIVQVPGTTDNYYYFTTSLGSGPFAYTLVDMSKNGGLGGVNLAFKNVVLRNKTDELMLVIRKPESPCEYWIITHHVDTFFVDEITSAGIILNPGQKIGVSTGGTGGALSYSPVNNKLVYAGTIIGSAGVYSLSFDPLTGVLSNHTTLALASGNNFTNTYSTAFSSDGTKLYVSSSVLKTLFQIDLSNGNAVTQLHVGIPGSAVNPPNGGEFLRRGPDDKIYLARNGKGFLGVINSPNAIGTSCNYVDNGLFLNGQACSTYGLPTTAHLTPVAIAGFDQTTLGCGVYAFKDTSKNTSTWAWDFGDGNTSALQHPTHPYTAPGTYTVQLIVEACTKDTSEFVLTVPSITLSVNLGNDTTLCSNTPLTLDPGISGATYLWSTSETTQAIQANVTGSYWVEVGQGLCLGRDSIEVMINSFPSVDFTGADSGCSPVCVNFTPLSPQAVSWNWEFGDGTSLSTASHCYSNPGTYSVKLTVTDANGCSAALSKTNFVKVFEKPLALFTANPNPATLAEPIIFFTDQSQGANAWNWSFGDVSLSSSTEQSPQFFYKDTGTFQVQLIVSNTYGCLDTINDFIKIEGEVTLYIPNTFTPNDDGLNDVFLPVGLGIDLKKYEMWIFDRWGNLIWKTQTWGQGWNGKANNGEDMAQMDVYVWKISAKDINGYSKRYVGHVNLIR